jgi:hypothetical protein
MNIGTAERFELELACVPEPMRLALLQLDSVSTDLILLQRQLILMLTNDGNGGAGTNTGATLPLMIARSIAGRLAEGGRLLQSPRSPLLGLCVETMSGQPASLAALQRLFDGPDNIVRRLLADNGVRSRQVAHNPENIDADTAREVLYAAGLFLAISRRISATLAQRHGLDGVAIPGPPDSEPAFPQIGDPVSAHAAAAAPLARTA